MASVTAATDAPATAEAVEETAAVAWAALSLISCTESALGTSGMPARNAARRLGGTSGAIAALPRQTRPPFKSASAPREAGSASCSAAPHLFRPLLGCGEGFK